MRCAIVLVSMVLALADAAHAQERPREPAESLDAPAAPAAPARSPRPARNRERPARPRPEPCLERSVEVVRYHSKPPRESARMAFTFCDGRPNNHALLKLSLLARPGGTARPTDEELRAYDRATRRRRDPADPAFVAPGIIRLDPGLLLRLQRIATRWPGREITVVSGFRPSARRSSRHRVGRALDVRVEGVERREVVAFSRTLENTGVGYYPNSHFTHVDVRDRQAFWVDRSGPGESADYGRWPPPHREIEDARDRALAAIADLAHVETDGAEDADTDSGD